MKMINYILQFFCVVLIIIEWILWIPYMIIIFPFTERFMCEWDVIMYPYYWLDKLRHPEIYPKRIK